MAKNRVHILTTVNSANVSKTGDSYLIRDVCGALDGIVMNTRLYPADQLTNAAPTLEGKPAPAGHPKNKAGRYISALNGEALASAWIGSYCTNTRHVAGRTLCDVAVNEAQAKASPAGVALINRLDAAISGENSEPIHVSTGLFCDEVVASGESGGKKYSTIATNIEYDHLAILLNEAGAGTPEQGVGMFLNSAGIEEEVETVTINAVEDKRHAGLTGWLRKLLGNSEMSFSQINDGLRTALPDNAYLREVFQRYVIWADYEGDKLYRQDYSIASDGTITLTGEPVEVIREVKYETVTNSEKDDPVKPKIIAALNAAGINSVGMGDDQLLQAYAALASKPAQDALTAANSKIAEMEIKANAAAAAELTALATKLAVNTSLTPKDFEAMGLARCQELASAGKAAPVIVGNSGAPTDEFAGYDLNSINKG